MSAIGQDFTDSRIEIQCIDKTLQEDLTSRHRP